MKYQYEITCKNPITKGLRATKYLLFKIGHNYIFEMNAETFGFKEYARGRKRDLHVQQ
jgi:hypothetical protein